MARVSYSGLWAPSSYSYLAGAGLHDAAAGDGAAPAAVSALLLGDHVAAAIVLVVGGIDLGDAGPVLGGGVVDLAAHVVDAGRADLVQLRPVPGERGHVLLAHLVELLGRLRRRHLHAALDGDGLELLGAHDRAQTGARRRPALVVHHRGDERELFAGRADAGDLQVLAVLRPQDVLGLEGVLAPDLGGVSSVPLCRYR